VNLTQQEVPVPALHPHTSYAHIPYPPDYIWSLQDHYDSERGLAFEQAIVEFVVKVIGDAAS